jgi:hypothetical protein
MWAGAFKPLTFPYRSKKYYETREEGIKWLREASNFYKLPIFGTFRSYLASWYTSLRGCTPS